MVCRRCNKEIERKNNSVVSWKYCYDCVKEIIEEYDKEQGKEDL